MTPVASRDFRYIDTCSILTNENNRLLGCSRVFAANTLRIDCFHKFKWNEYRFIENHATPLKDWGWECVCLVSRIRVFSWNVIKSFLSESKNWITVLFMNSSAPKIKLASFLTSEIRSLYLIKHTQTQTQKKKKTLHFWEERQGGYTFCRNKCM